jgi:hypothetical protein
VHDLGMKVQGSERAGDRGWCQYRGGGKRPVKLHTNLDDIDGIRDGSCTHVAGPRDSEQSGMLLPSLYSNRRSLAPALLTCKPRLGN